MKASSIFFSILSAITIAVFIFAPERLPSGVGITPVPIEAYARPSIFAQGQVAGLKNLTGKTLHNVKISLFNPNGEIIKGAMREQWPPGESMELGWLEGWEINKGTRLKASASGYFSKTWQY
ncbi:MAG TPA: hypothetical protein EYJ00_03575 [Gammaproteobacteria bacterium]|nr:hypothetical protein [Gammaproteobacteria bacterium]